MSSTLRDQIHGLVDEAIPDDAPPLPTQPTSAADLVALLATYGAEHGRGRDPASGAFVGVRSGDALAELLAAALPTSGTLPDRIGPCYRTVQLVRLLSETGRTLTDEAVRARRRSGGLIGLRTRDRRWVYPAWQFHTRPGRLIVRDDVLALWGSLGDHDDPWSRAAWLTGRRADLDRAHPLAWLDRHGLDSRLRAAAADRRRRTAA